MVDDCSTDDTYEWIKKAASLDTRVKAFRNSINSGKRKSLINATRHAMGEYCISVDSDVILDKDATRELISCFIRNPEIGAVGGKVSVSNPNVNWITQTQAIKYFFGYELFKSLENRFASVMCLSGCLTAYRKQALLQIEHVLHDRNLSGLPIKYGEDRFLTHQLVLHGWKTIINLKARCATKSPTTLSGLFSQQLRWRRSNIIDWYYSLKHMREHVRKINLGVLTYYFSLAFYILVYPILVFHSLIFGYSLLLILVHLVVLACLAAIYQLVQRARGEQTIDNPLAYIGMGLILPVSYLVLTPLALFTLDSGSWETR